jgi:hypothetical protein
MTRSLNCRSSPAARIKLEAALPDGLRDHASRVADRFHLDAPSWYSDADKTPT